MRHRRSHLALLAALLLCVLAVPTAASAAPFTVTDPGDAIAKAYRVVAPPQTYFIDADGVLQGIQIGEVLPADFDTQYAKIAP